MLSASLDLFDGILARRLGQTSQLGILLDIVADNILRTSVWMAVAIQQPNYAVIASLLIATEWCTMMVNSTSKEHHWKDGHQQPWWVKQVLSSNFKSPLGVLAIYGLYGSNLWLYVTIAIPGWQDTTTSPLTIRLLDALALMAHLGRIVAWTVETYMIYYHVASIVQQDMEKVASYSRQRKNQ
jgi:phosphatidylglycerophosphate synthase